MSRAPRPSSRAWALAGAGVWLGALLGCGGGRAGGDGGTDAGVPDAGNPALVEAWLTPHNAERAGAQPPPDPPLPALVWSASLAATAQAYAEGCRFVHNPALSEQTGENLYAASGSTGVTAGEVVTAWAREKASYDYATDTCAAGKVCGHYTQLVSRRSTSVGCGVAICSTNSPFGGGTWQYWLCNYAPAGNVVGQRPY